MTAFAISWNSDIGIFRTDICRGVTVYVLPVGTVAVKLRMPKSEDTTYFGLYMSTHDNIASCIMLVVVDLVVRLLGGGSFSLSCDM